MRAPGWFKQMAIKLAISQRLDEYDFYITLDTDIFCIRPISAEILIPGGRAITQWEGKNAHPEWWEGSRKILQKAGSNFGPGLGVTPNILSVAIAKDVLERIRITSGRKPIDEICQHTSFVEAFWTEYSIYTEATSANALRRYHWLPGYLPSGSANCLHSRLVIWSEEELNDERNLVEEAIHSDIGYFGVFQSSIGIDPSLIFEALRPRLQILAEGTR